MSGQPASDATRDDLRRHITSACRRWKQTWDRTSHLPAELLDDITAAADAYALAYARDCLASVRQATAHAPDRQAASNTPNWYQDGADQAVVFAPGRRVRYTHPDNGWDSDQALASERLICGAVYTIESADIGRTVSYVHLDGVEGKFNTVQFNTVLDDAPEREAAT